MQGRTDNRTDDGVLTAIVMHAIKLHVIQGAGYCFLHSVQEIILAVMLCILSAICMALEILPVLRASDH